MKRILIFVCLIMLIAQAFGQDGRKWIYKILLSERSDFQ